MFRYLLIILLVFFVANASFAQQERLIEQSVNYDIPYFLTLNGKKAKKVFHPNKGNWNHANHAPDFITYLVSSYKNPSFKLTSFSEQQLSSIEKSCLSELSIIGDNYLIEVA